ncbi:hypothetical protein Jab_2c28760 [Janthinobacterium sp. HH01]|uniref:hypothetical protein n=1 Tax=Janthinobacterium sp. HH01 TaxID=1198452 RepID=UPI0002AE82D7|nr:hypothetical protein [Janthinobacterium sp. HH01]ELX10776.1 hypothetical protein Jab_2c28760 [Janthinobacterium sp. HH01]
MNIRQALPALLFAVSALSHAGESKPEIYTPVAGPAGSFIDITLRIDSIKCDQWSDCKVRANGVFQGKPVGLDLALVSQGGQGKIYYRSIGADSDALLAALSSLYKMPANKRQFASTATADIIFLGLSAQEMSGKVYFSANGPEDDYAELYTNINKTRGTVEIREKDMEYRRNVIRALSK